MTLLNSKAHQPLLNRMFVFYAKSGHSFFAIDSFDTVQRENDNLDLSEVLNMLRDLRIMPQCVSRDAVTTAFKACAAEDAGTVEGVDMARLLSATEFIPFLVKLADSVFTADGPMATTSFAQPDADAVTRVCGLCALFHAAALSHRHLKPSARAEHAKEAPPVPGARGSGPRSTPERVVRQRAQVKGG